MKGRVTEDGLLLASGRRLPWSDVYYVDWTERGARLATPAGVVDVSRDDGEAAEREIAPWEAERDAWARDVDAQRRLDWAGVTSGTQAVTRQGWGPRLFAGMFWLPTLFSLIAVVLLSLHGGRHFLHGFALLMLLVGGLYSILGVVMWRLYVGPKITRSADGLTLGDQRIAWSDLRALGQRPTPVFRKLDATQQIVLTRRGRAPIKEGYQDGEAVRTGLRRAVAERRQAVAGAESRGLFAPSLTRPGEGLWLDGDGLVVVASRRARRIPWARLSPPIWRAHGSRLPADGKKLWLARYLGGDALGHAIDAHLAGDEAVVDAAGELRAAVIERWLGVPPGGSLRCRLSPWAMLICGAVLVGSAALLVGAPHGGGGFVSWVVIAAMMLVAMLRSARAVEADAKGLSVRRGKRRDYYAWSEIESLRPRSYEWEILTSRGKLTLATTAKGCDKVIGIIKRLLAMRETGAVLPAIAPTPESALSLARMSGPEAGERGLSVSRDE